MVLFFFLTFISLLFLQWFTSADNLQSEPGGLRLKCVSVSHTHTHTHKFLFSDTKKPTAFFFSLYFPTTATKPQCALCMLDVNSCHATL